MKEPKVPISLRVDPDLKTEIETEAFESGLTTSKYLENILQNRGQEAQTGGSPDEAWEELVGILESEKVELENTNEELETAVVDLSLDYQQLKSVHEQQNETMESLQQEIKLLRERDQLPNSTVIKFAQEEKVLFQNMLEDLQLGHPGLSNQELLLACLRTTLKNEKSYFFIHQLGANV